MDKNELLRIQDLVDNPTARVPICLCLDTSGSMNEVPPGSGEIDYERGPVYVDGKQYYFVKNGGTNKITELYNGIQKFYEAIRDDEIAELAAEICIVTFNDTAQCVVDFANIERHPEIPTLIADGNTAMGEGVNLALDLLEKRKQEYKERGVDYFQPWLVLMTDGVPNGSQEEFNRAVARINELVEQKRLTVFPIGIGEECDMVSLGKFSPKRAPLRLQGLKFKEFFEWLGKSVSVTSQSMPGESIKLPADKISTWATLDG